MPYAAICHEDLPEYRPAGRNPELGRVLRAIRRVFPEAKLLEVRRVERLPAATRPHPIRRRRKLGGPAPMV